MCGCNNIDLGSYENQVMLRSPKWSSHEFICVDTCLKNEILELWSLGIQTTGCCCGHNKLEPFIGVRGKDIPSMFKLGYEHHSNEMDLLRMDSFYPKSIN